MQNIIATPSKTREIINKYHLGLLKRLGQNFLIDGNIIGKIIDVAKIKEDDLIIEIGPGIGALTQEILNHLSTGKLFAIEKDSRFVKILTDLFSSNTNLEIINQDVLEIKWDLFLKERGLEKRRIKVLANLPYYITTPIIMDLLEAKGIFSQLVFMVQKEVAQRMIALPGGKDYGRLSIVVQYYSQAEIIYHVPPSVFIPRPEVDSSIISLKPYSSLPIQLINRPFFFKIVKAIFQQRRKNIKNALSTAVDLDFDKEMVLDALKETGIDQRVRGEKLSIERIASLSNILWKKSRKGW